MNVPDRTQTTVTSTVYVTIPKGPTAVGVLVDSRVMAEIAQVIQLKSPSYVQRCSLQAVISLDRTNQERCGH